MSATVDMTQMWLDFLIGTRRSAIHILRHKNIRD